MAKRKYNGMSRNAMQREAVKILHSETKMIKGVNKFTWKVRSRSNPKKWHTVKMNESGLECTCAYCQNRKKARCVHGLAIEMLILQNTFVVKPGDKKVVVGDEIPLQCPKGHTDCITRAGKRKRKYRDPAQIYECHKCESRFTWDEIGFSGMHYPPDAVMLALWLFNVGNSPETISTILKAHMRISVHEITIERWAKRFNSLVEIYVRDLPIQTGGIWTVDEKMITRIKTDKGTEKKMYVFTMLDWFARFVLAFQVATEKDNYNANKLFADAKTRAACVPQIIKSDKLPAFKNAYKKVFSTRVGSEVIHWSDCHIRGEFKEINGQERTNSTIGSLIRSKRSIKSPDSIIVRGSMLYYNYLRPHRGIGKKTPAEMANIIIRGTDQFKTLIQNAILSALQASAT